MIKLDLQIRGIDKVIAGMSKMNGSMSKYMVYAGREAWERELQQTKGMGAYPNETAHPPMPMTDKQRRGFFAKLRSGEIEVPWRRGQSPKSERYGSNWYIKDKKYGVVAGNRSSYAGKLIGDNQARYMAGIGWRKLSDVAKEKKDRIQAIFQGWVDKLIKDANL